MKNLPKQSLPPAHDTLHGFHIVWRRAHGRNGLACWLAIPHQRRADTPALVAIHGIQRGAEEMARSFAARAAAEGLDVTIVRPRTILGHGRLGIFQILFEWVRRSRPVYLLGSGHNRYQFVHADDLAAVCLLADQKKGPAVYLAGAERFGTLRELLEGLVSHAGSESPVRSLPFGPTQLAMQATGALGVSPLGAYHALMYGRELFFDVSDTRRELGWEPRWSNAEMIADSYDYYVAHREEILARSGASHHRSPVKLGVLALLEKLP